MFYDMADAKNSVNNEFSDSSVTSLSSCLRSRKGIPKQEFSNRTVSFPEDENQIVTGYLDPPNPWEYAESASKESVIAHYKESCERHGTAPIPSVLEQLEGYEVIGDRQECLSLKGELLSAANCEPLEEIFKRIQLVKVDLDSTSLDDEAAVVMFDMIEYYEAATHLVISHNDGISGRGWQACSRMLKKAKCLEVLECRGTTLTEQYITILGRALRLGTQLQVLKLDNCSLSGRPMLNLVAALKMNSILKELHLGENFLNCHDALQLAALLKSNSTLQLLDISNNCLEDVGTNHLLDGLIEQESSPGLSMLVLWNNKITINSAEIISWTLLCVSSLEVLNIGRNCLGDETIIRIKDALVDNRTLQRLGIQSTNITCKGASTLSEIITENKSLQRVDIRDNNILVDGLKAIHSAIKVNNTITRLDIDAPRLKESLSEQDLEAYTELWDEIRVGCRDNLSSERDNEALERIKTNMRKISLTCNTLKLGSEVAGGGGRLAPYTAKSARLYPAGGGRLRSPAPSPIPSPVTSPSPTRTRFQVSKVTEENASAQAPTPVVSGGSRFKVTVVDPGSPSAEPPATPVTRQQNPSPEKKGAPATDDGMVSRAGRKFTSWVNPALLTESRTVEKLLGLLPWGRGGGGPPAQDLINNNSSSGATWPPQQAPPPAVQGQQHSASTPSLVHTGTSLILQ